MKLKQMLMDGDPPFLPDEIITNILKRLPVKTLITFQCVSKHWKNLIKTPSFVQHHLHHHSSHSNPNLLIEQTLRDRPLHFSLLDDKMQFREFENTPIWMNSKLHIVDSCNGLFCLSDYNTIPPAPLLWNPATREVRRIPSAFDEFPIPNGWYFGFGFSPIINAYKIVRFSETDMIYSTEVYSLSTGSWKNIYSENLRGVTLFCDGVTVDGFMFWYGSIPGSNIMGTEDKDVIISFDLVTEVFTVTPSPASLSHTGVKLSVYDGKLAIISNSWSVNSQYSCIYFGVMEERGAGSSGDRWSSSWRYVFSSVPFKLYAGTVWRNQIVYIDHEMPRLSHETEGEMENAKPKCRLYLINVSTNERKGFVIPGYGHGFSASVYNYVESLVQIGNIQD